MTKPNDIPQDVWDKAHDTSLLLVADLEANIETIARAIMAAKEEEREECAKIAERLNGWGADFGRNGVAEHIARVIRDPKLANNTNKD